MCHQSTKFKKKKFCLIVSLFYGNFNVTTWIPTVWRGYLIFKDTFPRRGGGGYLGWFLLGMCRLPLSAPHPLQSILWPIIDPKVVTFGQICNFRDPNLLTFFFYELTHFLNWMKNNLLFTYSTNILVRLLTLKNKRCLTPKKSENVRPHHT